MKREDLRIGIILYDSLREKEIQVSEKYLREFIISENVFFDRYKPIIINEHYLLNNGFVKKYEGLNTIEYKLTGHKFELVFIKDINMCSVYLGNNMSGKISYIHEFQNISHFLLSKSL